MKSPWQIPLWLRIAAAAVLILCAFAVYALRIGSDLVGAAPEGARLKRIEQSPHYVDGAFTNSLPTGDVEGNHLSKLAAYFSDRPTRTPVSALPAATPRILSEPTETPHLTWLGHATVLIQWHDLTIISDPVFEKELPLLFGATTRFQPSPLARDSLPPADIVLISHDHFDHLEKSSVTALASDQTTFVVPLGVGAHLESWGIATEHMRELDWWESLTIDSITITCTPARHLSGRSLLHRNETLWASFVLTGPRSRLFYSGDTGYSPHFKEIGDRLGPFDLTLMQIGAYDDAWPDIHLTPAQAAQAQRDLGGNYLLPVHWGTYDIALHPWREPIELLSTAVADTTQLLVPTLGQTVDLSRPPPLQRWWETVP